MSPVSRSPRHSAKRRPSRRRRRFLSAAVVVVLAGVTIGVRPWAFRSSAAAVPRVAFGMGDEISGAITTPIYRNHDIDMVTSWYNGPSDLGWMSGYSRGNTISDIYATGESLELVVWLANDPAYAVSRAFQSDLKELVSIYKGNGPVYGPLYVVLFTEFETYSSAPGYAGALRAAYLEGVKSVHAADSHAYVALGFGGYDWTASSPVRNLTFWRPAIAASDFTAFQAMQDEGSTGPGGQNIIVPEIEDAVRQLGRYGKPVMISHFKLWGDAPAASAAFARVVSQLLTVRELRILTSEGLFAWGFMSDDYINEAGPGLRAVEPVVAAFGTRPAAL